jgi:hypothetical protein
MYSPSRGLVDHLLDLGRRGPLLLRDCAAWIAVGGKMAPLLNIQGGSVTSSCFFEHAEGATLKVGYYEGRTEAPEQGCRVDVLLYGSLYVRG